MQRIRNRPTLYRLLLGFLAVMLVPILTLSFFITRSFSSYIANDLVQNHISQSQHLRDTFDMVVDQLNANAYGLLNSSTFTTQRLQEAFGNFKDVQRMLAYACNSSGFVDDAVYLNSDMKMVYTTTNAYDYAAFERFGPCYTGVGADELESLVLENKHQFWLSMRPVAQGGREALTYVFTDKHGLSQPGSAVLFFLDRTTMDKLFSNVTDVTVGSALLTDRVGNVLYRSSEALDPVVWEAVLDNWPKLAAAPYSIIMEIENEQHLIYQLQSAKSALRYTTIVPYSSVLAPVTAMRAQYLLLMTVAVVACALIILLMTRVIYGPIHKLVTLAQQTGEMDGTPMGEMEVAASALSRVAALNRTFMVEDITLKLLRSYYPSLEAMIEQTASVGYSLRGPLLRIMVIHLAGVDGGVLERSTYEEVRRYVRVQLRPKIECESVLYPESSNIYAVLSSQRELLADVQTTLEASSEALGKLFSLTLTFGLSDIGRVEQSAKLLEQARSACQMTVAIQPGRIAVYSADTGDVFGMRSYPAEAIEVFQLALQSGREERVLFALEPLLHIASGVGSHFFKMRICYEIINSALATFRELEYPVDIFEPKYRDLMQRTSAHTPEELIVLIRAFCLEVCTYIATQKQEAPEETARIHRMLVSIDERCHEENFSVKALADQYGMTVSNLSHFFKKQTGSTVSDYISLRRFGKAKKLLRTTSLPVYEIALQCGYLHNSTFLRQFKKHENTTPIAYRNVFGNQAMQKGDSPVLPPDE